MLRKPQLLEVVALILTIAGLFLSILLFNRNIAESDTAFRDVTYSTLITIGLCVVGQTFVARHNVRYFFLVIHFLVCVLMLLVLKNRFPAVEATVVLLLMIQISFRLSITVGSVGCLIVLVIATGIGLVYLHEVFSRLFLFLLEAAFAFVLETLIHYRENLVGKSELLESQERSLENLSAANRSFVGYLEYVEEDSAERERFRITRELHDTIGYSMTNIAMMMNASKHLIDENPEKLLEYCEKTNEVASGTLLDTRDILYKLRGIKKQPPSNSSIFFTRLCRDFRTATGVLTECSTGNLPDSIDEGVFTVLFRSVQVGFINALRHGDSTHIKLSFWLSPDELRMTIWNNTRSRPNDRIAVEAVIPHEGIGLKGIRERLETYNGTLLFGRVKDGFRLTILIPKGELNVETDTRVNRG